LIQESDMHRSRLAGFIIDCKTDDLDRAARFWSDALGLPVIGPDGNGYIRLDASARDLVTEVQKVSHDSRVHLDIESDDVEAEVARLEALGARRLEAIKTWVVLEAPTGQRFCVVRAKQSLVGRPGARTWP
jgi:catechol 2,3-dioxygenase-like lactoylglutathione lyase family enzyme